MTVVTAAALFHDLSFDTREARWLAMARFHFFDLSGRLAELIGGNRGIGRAMALGLARAGASVALLARTMEQNQLVLAELKAVGTPALVVPLVGI